MTKFPESLQVPRRVFERQYLRQILSDHVATGRIQERIIAALYTGTKQIKRLQKRAGKITSRMTKFPESPQVSRQVFERLYFNHTLCHHAATKQIREKVTAALYADKKRIKRF